MKTPCSPTRSGLVKPGGIERHILFPFSVLSPLTGSSSEEKFEMIDFHDLAIGCDENRNVQRPVSALSFSKDIRSRVGDVLARPLEMRPDDTIC